jgi:DNA/RNA endonuclease YhcR with UshA esterase domain
MLLRQERLAFGLLVAVAIGITLGSLGLAGIDKGTLAKEFCQTQTEGTLVRIEGMIDELRWTETGGHLNVRIAGTPVFLPSGVAEKLALRKGDRVLIYGIIQTYRGEKEIVVQEAGDVKIIGTDDH